MWPCYEMFTNNTIRTSLQGFGQDGQYKGDMAAGYFQQNMKVATMNLLIRQLPV